MQVGQRSEQLLELKMPRRDVLKAGFLAALGLSGSTETADAQIVHGIPSGIHTNLGPLSGFPRSLLQTPASSFPYNASSFSGFFPNRGNGIGGYPFFYGGLLGGSLYYRNNLGRSPYNNYGAQSRQGKAKRKNNCCCKPQQDQEVPNSTGIRESRFEYPMPQTPEEKAVLEDLYVSSVNSLAKNFGYQEKFQNGQLRNKEEHFFYYLTPILFAHDLYNKETLQGIEQGLKQVNPQLIDTYGSLQFFQDAMKVIEFNKIKQGTVPELGSDTLIRDTNRIIKELKKIEAKVRTSQTTFKIAHLEENAEFIVRAYHQLDDRQLAMIADGLTKAVNPDKAVRDKITAQQSLYIEQFTTEGTNEMIGRPLFLLLVSILNDLHSDDKDDQGKLAPLKKIPDLIEQETTSKSTSRLKSSLMARLSNPVATVTDKLRDKFFASLVV